MKKSLFVLLLSLCVLAGGAQVDVKEYSPKLTASTVNLMEKAVLTRTLSPEQTVNVFIRLADGADIERIGRIYDVKFNVGTGNLYTAVVPMSMLAALADDDGVEAVDAGQEVHMMMDAARRLTHVDEVHAGTSLTMPYTGKGVLVGIIDAGFDFNHPNFRDKDGNCRIQAVWDQNNFLVTDSDYGYGKEYRSTAEIVSAGRDMELTGDTHGTHVAGIATGSYDGPYLGVAPEADIVLVSTNKTEQGIIDGIDYLLEYAEKAGKPISINLSIGTVLGYKDGTDAFSVLIDNLMEGQTGKVISIAAGNEGDRNSTLSGSFGADCTGVKSFWIPPTYNRDNLFIQGERGADYELVLSLKNKDTGEELFTKTFTSDERQTLSFKDFGSQASDNGHLSVSVSENPSNGNPCFRVTMTYDLPETEIWEVALSSESGRYMINSDYGEFVSLGKNGYSAGTNESSIAATATGFNSIAVGAYVSKNIYNDLSGSIHDKDWTLEDIYPLSGKGPTYDNRIKPDVVAPGAAVVSSFNSYANSFYVSPEDKVASVVDDYTGRTYSWGVASGTSMATPVVTGTLALWLEANSDLSLEDIRRIIESTSSHDTFTGEVANGVFGHGKLDAFAGLKYLEQNTSIIQNEILGLKYELHDGILFVSTDTDISRIDIYGIDGKMLGSEKGYGKEIRIRLPSDGVFFVRIVTDTWQKTLKLAF